MRSFAANPPSAAHVVQDSKDNPVQNKMFRIRFLPEIRILL